MSFPRSECEKTVYECLLPSIELDWAHIAEHFLDNAHALIGHDRRFLASWGHGFCESGRDWSENDKNRNSSESGYTDIDDQNNDIDNNAESAGEKHQDISQGSIDSENVCREEIWYSAVWITDPGLWWESECLFIDFYGESASHSRADSCCSVEVVHQTERREHLEAEYADCEADSIIWKNLYACCAIFSNILYKVDQVSED